MAKISLAACASCPEVAAVCSSHHISLMSAAALGADAGSETRSEPLSLLQAAHQQDHQVSVKEQRNRLAMVHDWDTSFDDIQQ